MKAITSVVSDRALRTQLREFQRLGLLRGIANASDGRVRIIDRTQIFVDHVNKKLSDLSVILKKHFYLIEKIRMYEIVAEINSGSCFVGIGIKLRKI